MGWARLTTGLVPDCLTGPRPPIAARRRFPSAKADGAMIARQFIGWVLLGGLWRVRNPDSGRGRCCWPGTDAAPEPLPALPPPPPSPRWLGNPPRRPQPRVVQRRHHRLAGTRGGDEQVLVAAKTTASANLGTQLMN